MEVTSHFVGLKINSRMFVNLFITLQHYLRENNLEQIIELQDIHSFHVSLYYLEKNILPEDLNSISDILAKLNKIHNDFVLMPDHMNYFKKGSKDYLGYVTCNHVDILQNLNKKLASQFKKIHVPDNQFEYIPHISLFRVLNNEVFQKHKDMINNFITKELNTIKNKNLFEGFFFFEVNSKFHPEIQFIVNLF